MNRQKKCPFMYIHSDPYAIGAHAYARDLQKTTSYLLNTKIKWRALAFQQKKIKIKN